MRKSNYLIGILVLLIGVSLPKYCLSGNLLLTKSANSEGGGNCPLPQKGCNLCETSYSFPVYITIEPTQFPFKIANIKVTNASSSGMDLVSLIQYPTFNIAGSFGSSGWEFYCSGGAYNRIIENAQSPYLDSEGNLNLRVNIVSKFCIQGGSSFPTSNFKINLIAKFNYYNPINGSVIRNSTSSLVHDTGILYDECDDSIPFYPVSGNSGPGPTINPRGPLLRNIEEENRKLELSAYPNPFNKKILLKIKI